MLTVVMERKTFTALANQRALLVSTNVEKNMKYNSVNNRFCNLIMGISPESVLFSFLRNTTELDNDSNCK